MTYYSTLQEAYNIERFSNKSKRSKNNEEPFMNDYSPQDDCYYKKEYGVDTKVCNRSKPISKFTNPNQKMAQQHIMEKSEYKNTNPSYIETSKMALNSSEISGYQTNQTHQNHNSCAPIQAPNYEYPISGECKNEFNKVMNTYMNDNTANNMSYEDINKDTKLKEIQPYYDEDLEQYFDINNLTNDINYKSSSSSKFMPNSNNIGYANDNTGYYKNAQNGESDDLLKTENYNLTEEDKKNALNALNVLKNIEEKIKKNEKKQDIENNVNQTVIEQNDKKIEQIINSTSSYTKIYNILINIALFIFIGIVIILLCDQIVELAIQIGMKKTVNILEPYLKMQQVVQIVPEQPPINNI